MHCWFCSTMTSVLLQNIGTNPKGDPHPLRVTLHAPGPQLLANNNLLSVSGDLPLLPLSHKWIPKLCDVLHLDGSPQFCVSLVVLQPRPSGSVKTNYDFAGCLLFCSCCCESAFCTCLHPEQRPEAQRAPFPVFPTPRPLPELPVCFRYPKRLLS